MPPLHARRIGVALLAILVAGCGRTPPSFVERPPLIGHSREVTSIAFSPDGLHLASRDSSGIKIWDITSGKTRADFPWARSDFGTVIYSPDGTMIATEDRDSVKFWFVDDSKHPKPLPALTLPDMTKNLSKPKRGSGLAFSPDGELLAMGGSRGEDDGSITFWNLADPSMNGPAAHELPELPRPITTVTFAPDGRTIGSGSMDGRIVLWNVDPIKVRQTIKAGRSYMAPVVFSPDGRLVASANELRYVKFWDATTGKEVGTCKGHIKAVLSLAFHPDGRTLVSGDSGGTLFVWDVPSRSMLTRLESSDRGKIWSLAFSPDGKILAAASEDHRIHLWDFQETTATEK